MKRVQERIDDYLAMGVSYVWVLDPSNRHVYVATPAAGLQESKEMCCGRKTRLSNFRSPKSSHNSFSGARRTDKIEIGMFASPARAEGPAIRAVGLTKHYRSGDGDLVIFEASTWKSPRARCWRWWANRARGSPRCCICWAVWTGQRGYDILRTERYLPACRTRSWLIFAIGRLGLSGRFILCCLSLRRSRT